MSASKRLFLFGVFLSSFVDVPLSEGLFQHEPCYGLGCSLHSKWRSRICLTKTCEGVGRQGLWRTATSFTTKNRQASDTYWLLPSFFLGNFVPGLDLALDVLVKRSTSAALNISTKISVWFRMGTRIILTKTHRGLSQDISGLSQDISGLSQDISGWDSQY